MRLSQNIADVFLADGGELTIADVLARSEHRGFGFLLVVFSLPVVLPFTPPGVSSPFAVLIAALAVQMMMRRTQPWFPNRVMAKKVKTGDSRFMKAMKRWAEFFERFLRPRMRWVYSPGVFRWFLGPVILLAATAMFLPFPGTNSVPSLAILLIALGLLEEDGVFGLVGALIALAGAAIAASMVVLVVVHGPQALQRISGG
ncbi:MAG: exopolysaccharide biosynthesis protein [Fimbriimonadaceae bacterium]